MGHGGEMSEEMKVHLYREMVRIRRFEQKCALSYCMGKMGGWLLLSIGQESTAVAIRSVMEAEDHSVSGPRGLGMALASGMSMESMMAELFGKKNGCNKGKGGMFSMMSPEHHHWGCYPIAAAQTPLAAGFAFTAKLRGEKGVSFCLMGEGAMNQGVFHESLNLAGLFDLPVVFVVENNQFAMGMSVERSSAYRECLARRAEGYGIDWDVVDGWEMEALRGKLLEARKRAVEESRPTVLEVRTYRYYGFSVADASHKKYRSPEEINWYKENRDPVKLWEERLLDEGVLDAGEVEQIHQMARLEAQAAIGTAALGMKPGVEDLLKDVYWECDEGTEAGREGRHFFNDEKIPRRWYEE